MSDLCDVGYDVVYVLLNLLKFVVILWFVNILLWIGYMGEYCYGLFNVCYVNFDKLGEWLLMMIYYVVFVYVLGVKLFELMKMLFVLCLDVDLNEMVWVFVCFNFDICKLFVVFCFGVEYGLVKCWLFEYFVLFVIIVY